MKMKRGAVPCGAAPFLSVNNDTEIPFFEISHARNSNCEERNHGVSAILKDSHAFLDLFWKKKSWEKSVP